MTVYLGTDGNEFILNGRLQDVNTEEIYGPLSRYPHPYTSLISVVYWTSGSPFDDSSERISRLW